jgi:hypothetical protein
MRNPNLTSQLQSLNALFVSTAAACGSDIEMRAHWAKYLCVLCSGFLENAIFEVYVEYSRRSSSPHVARFVSKMLEKIQNPRPAKFIDTANDFKGDWRDPLESYLKSDGRGEAINAIMTNRHRIAHGESSQITLSQLREYLDRAVEVVEFIEAQCA